jgi:hypothetical protein
VVLDDDAEVVVVVDDLVMVGTVGVVVVVDVVAVRRTVVVVVGKLGARMASMRWANLEAHIGAEDAPGARHVAATR